MKKFIIFLTFVSIYSLTYSQVNLGSGLVAYYPFNGNANDISGNGNNAIFNNATLTSDRFGNNNSAYFFNGIDNYIQIPNSPSINPANQISLCALVKPMGFYIGPCHGNSILMKGDADYLPGNYLLRFDDNAYTAQNNCFTSIIDSSHQNFYGVNAQKPTPGYSPYINKNQWYCLIYTYDGTFGKFYIDGILIYSESVPGLSFSNSYDLFFGKLNHPSYPYWFNGVLDEIRIYNRALNDQEVNALCSKPCANIDSVRINYTETTCKGFDFNGMAFVNSSSISTWHWSFGDGGIDSFQNTKHVYATSATYTVKLVVKDINGCMDSVATDVIPSGINITKSNDTTVCANESVQLFAGGGISYSWTPSSTLNNANINNPIANPLTTTIYHVTVTNSVGCSKPDSILVTVKNLPVISKSNDTSICANTSVQLSATGGNSYAWTPVSSLNNASISNPIATPLATTIYYVTVTNTVGCVKTDSIKITVNAPPTISKSVDSGICINSSIQLFASGGISYSWTPASTLNNASIPNPIASPLATTTYYVNVTTAAGCSKSDSVKITVSAPPVITKSNDTSVCKSTPVQLFAGGGASYLWAPAASLSNATIPNPIATPATSTVYYVKVTNANGCARLDSVHIMVNPSPLIIISKDTTICNQASVQLFVSGGNTYLWSPTSSLDNATINNPIATPLATTTYIVNIKDSYSCTYKDSIIISVRTPAVFTISPDASICIGTSKQLQASGGDTYSWSPSAGLNNPNISIPLASPSATTVYTVTIHENTCNQTGTLSTTLTALPAPNVNAFSANDITCSQGSSQLSATGAANYSWAPGTGLNNSNISNPVANPSTTTVYTVTGKDVNGCPNTDTVTVKVNFNGNALFLLPNSFTPNGDGINDCFGVKYWGQVQDLDFNIYNRYGEKVFHSNDANICWDGKYKQKLQDSDIFVYTIKAKTACGLVERKGTVTLIR